MNFQSEIQKKVTELLITFQKVGDSQSKQCFQTVAFIVSKLNSWAKNIQDQNKDKMTQNDDQNDQREYTLNEKGLKFSEKKEKLWKFVGFIILILLHILILTSYWSKVQNDSLVKSKLQSLQTEVELLKFKLEILELYPELKRQQKQRRLQRQVIQKANGLITNGKIQAWDDLERLQTLYLSFCQLEQLPQKIATLTNLKNLFLHENKLKELPEKLGNLKNLRDIRIYRNKITKLPQSLRDLKKLQILYAFENSLSQLPDSIGKLTKLQILHLSDNQLKMLPQTLGSLKQLKQLYIFNNTLRQLPQSLRNLTKLQSLVTNNNNLTFLPKRIGQLQQLKRIDIQKNTIMELPPSFEKLQELTQMRLDIGLIPDERIFNTKLFSSLSNLKTIKVFFDETESNKYKYKVQALKKQCKQRKVNLQLNQPSKVG